MFQRRVKRSFRSNLRETLWPSMGWRRVYLYFRHRVFRGKNSTHGITAGLATGAALSFSPLVGTHLFQVVFLAWIFRLNPLAGIVGTVFGNPWTFPFIFWVDYRVGAQLFSLFGNAHLIALPADLTLSYLFGHPGKLMLPMLAGGYLCALISWPALYGILYYPVSLMRRAYQTQRMKKLLERRKLGVLA